MTKRNAIRWLQPVIYAFNGSAMPTGLPGSSIIFSHGQGIA